MASARYNRSSTGLFSIGAICLAALAWQQPASAAQFGVRVVDEAGAPMEGAAVCIGLPGNSRQFGALFTDAQGTALLDVPAVPLQVTVSKNRFTGVRMSEPARHYNMIRQVTLIDGVPGPRCNAGSALTEADVHGADRPDESSLVISRIEVNTRGGRTTLEPVTGGSPTHYRVANDPVDLQSTTWQRLNGPISLARRPASDQPLYLQVRHYEGSSRAWLETVSNVITLRLTALN